MTKVLEFSVVHFEEDFKDERTGRLIKRPVIVLYALGEDGIVYEMSGGKWLALPISPELMRELKPAAKS